MRPPESTHAEWMSRNRLDIAPSRPRYRILRERAADLQRLVERAADSSRRAKYEQALTHVWSELELFSEPAEFDTCRECGRSLSETERYAAPVCARCADPVWRCADPLFPQAT
jgi:RNA polymerase-binding transcription factor DksA